MTIFIFAIYKVMQPDVVAFAAKVEMKEELLGKKKF